MEQDIGHCVASTDARAARIKYMMHGGAIPACFLQGVSCSYVGLDGHCGATVTMTTGEKTLDNHTIPVATVLTGNVDHPEQPCGKDRDDIALYGSLKAAALAHLILSGDLPVTMFDE